MPINKDKTADYIKMQLKLSGVAEPMADTYLETAMNLGGALFWHHNWYFAEKIGTLTTTAGTAKYLTKDYLEADVNGIISIRRLTDVDEGALLREETSDSFDRRSPYPTSETQAKPINYKLITDKGLSYIVFSPPPDAAYSMEVSYTLGWNIKRLALIPDDFADAYMEACMVFAVPIAHRAAQYAVYESVVRTAEQHNTLSRKDISEMRDDYDGYYYLPEGKANPLWPD